MPSSDFHADAGPDGPAERYTIRRKLARGGMGVILEATDQSLDRSVAMKVMVETTEGNEVAQQRFLREALVLARLAHPNIVPIYEFGRDPQGRRFYAMKLVKGRTLQAVLNELKTGDAAALERFPLDRLLNLFLKVCDAIEFAHFNGIIHRDLKPENIMVGEFGEVLVMDWGLAKILHEPDNHATEAALENVPTGFEDFDETQESAEAPVLTLDGTVFGSPNFMPPEQAAGLVAKMDTRSDIYALGGILYAILTLRPPARGKTLREMLANVVSGNIEPPTHFNRTKSAGTVPPAADGTKALPQEFPLRHCPGGRVPEALSAVAMKALTLDQAGRYQTVRALAEEVVAYQNGFATAAEEAGALQLVRLFIRRHKIIVAAVCVLVLVVVGFLGKVISAEHKAEASALAANAEAARAREALAKSALSLAEAARREGNGAEMQAALYEVPDDLRDDTWNYLLEQSDTSIARVRTSTGELEDVAANPERPGTFAVADRDGRITVLEATGARQASFAPGFAQPAADRQFRIAFSLHGARIAVARHGAPGIVVHNARDGKKLMEWNAPPTERLEFHLGSKLLLQTVAGGAQLNVWDSMVGGKLVWTASPTNGNLHAAFTPDGKQLVMVSGKGTFRVVNARDGVLARTFTTRRGMVTALVANSDGTVLAGGADGFVSRLELQDGRTLAEFRAHDRAVRLLALTPDGGRIVTVAGRADGRQDIRIWDASNGAAVQSLLGGSGEARNVSVHPLTGELFVCGPNSRVWNLTGSPEKWALPGDLPTVAFWGADDAVFAPGPGHTNALFQLRPGGPSALWLPLGAGYREPSVSADGRFAAVGQLGATAPIRFLRKPGPEVEEVRTFKPKQSLSYLRLSPDGDRLVAVEAGDSAVEVWNTATGTQPVQLDRKDIKRFNDLGWLAGGKQLVGLVTAKAERGNSGSLEWLVRWDAVTGQRLQVQPHRAAMDVLAIAPDGRRFAEAGVDKLVRIRDAETLAVQQEFRAHDGAVTALAWHPTRPVLASASADLSIRLWDLENRRRLDEFRGPLAPPTALVFSPGGQRLGCAADHLTRIWEPEAFKTSGQAEPADGWTDALATLTSVSLRKSGNGWSMNNGALFSPSKSWATLPLLGNLAGLSYQVRVKLRQLAPKDVFHLAFPVGDRMVGFDLEGFREEGYYTGLILVNGKQGKDCPGVVTGKQINDSAQHDLELTVRLDGANVTVSTTLDGQPLYAWTGPTTALSPHWLWASPSGFLTLGSNAADWAVYEVKVKRLDGKP